jgi:hypothetical protein
MAQDFDTPITPPPPFEEPRKRNSTVVVIVVVVLVLLCCCCLAMIWAGWTFGDAILQSMGITY